MAYLLVLSAVACVLLYYGLSTYQRLKHNISCAKSSGLPYVVTPVHVFGMGWLATYYLWIPFLKKLPASVKGLWLEIMDPEWAHRLGHEPFEKIDSDVFLVVSPSKIAAFVADAEVVAQITTRRNDFPKPLELYTRLDLYGKNLVSSEGADWRMHRKLTAPSFGERNNELVFTETLHHTTSLLRLWTGTEKMESRTLNDPGTDTMSWALYIISGAGFDIRVTWPHEEGKHEEGKHEEGKHEADKADRADSVFKGSQPPPGHTMNYREALSELLHNIMWTFMGPPSVLSKSPFKVHRTVAKALLEWGDYMEEILQLKKTQVSAGQDAHGMDLFRALIRNSGILDASQTSIQESDLLGNAFVLMLAGHETTANTLHYSLIFLAMRWSSQKKLQDEIDEVIQGRPIEEWKYEEIFQKLFNGMPAAVMNETLRVLTPVINIPKSTAPGRPQQFTMDGQQYTMPGETQISLSCAIHKNPKYWPAPPGEEVVNGIPDTQRFRPERWLNQSATTEAFTDIAYDDEELRGPSGEDTSSNLFRPVRGSYIPFSDGFRSCIGRRFAQVELLTAFAVIFTQYSVELAADEWASEEQLEKMSENERKEIWQKAVDRTLLLLRTKTSSIITLQLRGHTIPIRLVKRGGEKLKFDY
ncbi:cytochrome P450 monooxygenase-like protein [Bimuria novae-zelandiae CBS 107.79]|uniref:Cytochrome P450 monooxygenase-like protein n=1 Tax=Bimuria novae-zelandiae CBS 107.79 TaxID=1447943 RepID=A0A6A5VT74_9PLEO|nr:cytochrome P450 monooxygenase-like protein [Bimuria novae-zelandiae CBS 107.79]